MIKIMRAVKIITILVILSFVVVIQNKAYAQSIVETIVGEVGGEPSPAPECGPGNSNIDLRLKLDFGVIMRPGRGLHLGDLRFYPAENPDCETRRQFYRALAIPSASVKFMSLLKPNNTFVIDCFRVDVTGSAGFVPTGNLMQYKNCYKIKEDFKPYAFLVLHETGHIMKHRNYRELQQFFPRTKLIREDPNCFASEGVIKTYNKRGLSDYSLTSESSAEAIALYVYNRKDGDFADIINFKSECPSIYQWAKSNIYGEGVEFN